MEFKIKSKSSKYHNKNNFVHSILNYASDLLEIEEIVLNSFLSALIIKYTVTLMIGSRIIWKCLEKLKNS